MFEQLSTRLQSTLKNLTGRGKLSEQNIKTALREVRIALLEADVALPVVKSFVARVQEKALGEKVLESLTPDQMLIRLVRDELTEVLGHETVSLNLKNAPPVVILLAGLQGAGKTTTAAKLAKTLIERDKKTVLLSSVDVYRPAAITQLQRLSEQVGADFYASDLQKPVDIARAAIESTKTSHHDVVIIDTAGRTHVDDAMMDEIKAVHASISPHEVLFVVDSMTGQEAANTARAFHDALALTGVVLTKVDGDARGGAALSVREVTGAPIKYLGMGEKVEALEVFHPDRIAQRILGMGDVLSLIEEVEHKVDKKAAQKLASKVKKGGQFDLADFASQLRQMQNMGGVMKLAEKMPGFNQLPPGANMGMADTETKKMLAVIDSMTPQERHFPDVLNGSRKRRIAKGAGLEVQAVNKLIKQHKQMQKMMKKMANPKAMKNAMRAMQGLKGRLPF